MRQLRDIPAPAKLNLFLHVVGRRADGYHLLQTVFRFIDLSDVLHVRRRDDGVIGRTTPLPGVPPEACLTVRAAWALKRATGTPYGVDIELEKHIPAGGGLGGGSSDAASVLLALNRLWGTGLSRAALRALALPLGADVPVFIYGQSAFAQGIGEELHAVELPSRWYVVIQPQVSVPTAAIFGDPSLTRDTSAVKITDFSSPADLWRRLSQQLPGVVGVKTGESVAAGMGLRPDGGGQGGNTLGRNDLESVVVQRYSQVALARQIAAQAVTRSEVGSGSVVRMSGSGSCLFIECVTKEQAGFIEAEIAATIRTSDVAASTIKTVTVCGGLDRHPLQHWAK